ncbi:hypothetical protein MMC17_007497 [Xylographa soralifera]|nr:hypothetical protein [Xylographa soralifera]
MPSAGFPTAHSSTSSMFPSSATSGTSIFDAWHSRSSKKATPHTDTASIRSSSTSTSLLSVDEQKARAQAASPKKTISFRDIATKGFGRSFPKYK